MEKNSTTGRSVQGLDKSKPGGRKEDERMREVDGNETSVEDGRKEDREREMEKRKG